MLGTWLLGVDGGGTHCRVRIRASDGSLVGGAEGGAANVFSSIDTAIATILELARAALATGGLDPATLSRCYAGLGLAGANVPSVAQALSRAPLPFAGYGLETDASTACRGAFAGGDGAVAILGTGTAYAVRAAGRTELLGGFGMLVSDQGSGADLGRRTLAAALLAFDGAGPASPLTEAVLARFGHRPAALAEFAKDARPRDFGALAPLVWDHAEAGDPVGARLVREGLDIVEAFLRRCLESGAPSVALLGGQAPRYRALLAPDLLERLAEPVGDALDGAIDLAREARSRAERRA